MDNRIKRYVSTYKVEEDIDEQLKDEDINLTLEEFTEVRDGLIQNKVPLINYSPHRSSTRNRSA